MKSKMILDIVNLVVLTLTLGILIWYTVETRRIANQTVESNTRPLLLRGGVMAYEDVPSVEVLSAPRSPKMIEFINHKNIALDIKGYIVIDSKKYNLLFSNEASHIKVRDGNLDIVKVGIFPNWEWLPSGGKIYATFFKDKFVQTDEDNQVFLMYKDIEGNSYYTKENKNYSQFSKRL